MLIFCKGNITYVLMLIRSGIKTFSEVTWLTTNATKFNVYTSIMGKQEVNAIC